MRRLAKAHRSTQNDHLHRNARLGSRRSAAMTLGIMAYGTLHKQRRRKSTPQIRSPRSPQAAPRSATLLFAKERGFFGPHFRTAAGELNHTKSVGLALDTYLLSEVYRFLKRAVSIKRVDFAVVALDNDLVNDHISFRPHYAGFVRQRIARAPKSCGSYRSAATDR